jgi:eukaryotic-like serine/threonine-protein kinase
MTQLLTQPKPQPASSKKENTLSGRYNLLHDLGKGATSKVSLARDQHTGELVAVKQLFEAVAEHNTPRMRREFHALEKFSHPNIVRVIEYADQAKPPYLVLEYVQGRDLGHWLSKSPPLEQVVSVFAGVADALEHVHQIGLVHRDLKPENIRVDFHGRPKLLDFGLTKPIENNMTAITRMGALVGTALFMAPEQCRAGVIDARTDLYSLGALMYTSFTGTPPFLGDDAIRVMRQHLETEPIRPTKLNANIPPMLEMLILSLLAKDPAERPQSAAYVRDMLRTLVPPDPLTGD